VLKNYREVEKTLTPEEIAAEKRRRQKLKSSFLFPDYRYKKHKIN
jgi:hypothetical protein